MVRNRHALSQFPAIILRNHKSDLRCSYLDIVKVSLNRTLTPLLGKGHMVKLQMAM